MFCQAAVLPLRVFALHVGSPHLSLPEGLVTHEEMALRWIHFVSGIAWIGLLYFFNLVAAPTMKQLEAPLRGRVFPVLMERALWWFRWSAVLTVLAGLRYFWLLLATDAGNAGDPTLAWRWFGWWLLVWCMGFALIWPFQLPHEGVLDNPVLRAAAIGIIVIAASWATLALNSGPDSSNAHLSISVGGGIGLLLLLNVWGIVWRAQKRLIAWTRASAEQGAPMPPEATRLARWSFIASRTGFWLSFPMLFFMGAASHYPFLSGMAR